MGWAVRKLSVPFAILNTLACGASSDPIVAPEVDAGVDASEPDATVEIDPEPDAAVTPEPDAAVPGPDCDTIPAGPLEAERLEGFTRSEDFQFDADGRFVGADAAGNVVRVSSDGESRLFIPTAGGLAGMRFLPGGDLVYARVDDGTLYRASPNGAVVPLLGGLVYPNGVEVDAAGAVYVSEFGAG